MIKEIMLNKKRGNSLVAVAIIVAGLIIAAAVMITSNGDPNGADDDSVVTTSEEGDLEQVRAPSLEDHIQGSPDAPIVVIEYSDTECPFCGRLHSTMNELVQDYEGQVAWVYRHLPLTQLHSKAVVEAHATECAAELGGNDGFWSYTNRLYEITPANNRLDLDELPNIAEFVGLDREAFNECMESERHLEKIETDFREAVKAAGANLGTPFNVVISPDGTRLPVSGALAKESWEKMFDTLLKAAAAE